MRTVYPWLTTTESMFDNVEGFRLAHRGPWTGVRGPLSVQSGTVPPWRSEAAGDGFAGRGAELGRIRRTLAGALEGRPSAVLVHGEAGIGKTRLVAEACRELAGSGTAVLWGTCVQFGAESTPVDATLGFVADAFRRHAELLVEFFGDEDHGCRDVRKHVAWYFKGYPVGGDIRTGLAMSSSLQHIDDLLGQLDRDAPYPGADAEGQRGRAGRPKRTSLPDKWLESREIGESTSEMMRGAEIENSGG